MSYIPITPFRRAVDVAIVQQALKPEPEAVPDVDKWQMLRLLGVVRKRLGLSDRTLSVLQALVAFHPDRMLSHGGQALVVYPSNRTICARLNGMPCSTMRRHVAALIDAGLIRRRDSPNGKRFVRHSAREAYGFDLTPLVERFAEVEAQAAEIEAENAHLATLRRQVSLMRRDLGALASFGGTHHPRQDGLWDRMDDQAQLAGRDLRRVLSIAELEVLGRELADSIAWVRGILETETDEMSTRDAENEQHHQSSNKDIETTKAVENVDATGGNPPADIEDVKAPPLELVTEACPEMQAYAPEGLRRWDDLFRTAQTVRPMMGISERAWNTAKDAMGSKTAAAVIAAMMERFEDIRVPEAYLRHLTGQAERGVFSALPMLMAVLRRREIRKVHSCELFPQVIEIASH